MARIFLTHIPDMLKNYYGERAVAALRQLGEVRINDTGRVLDADALGSAASGCEIVVSNRQTPGPDERGGVRAHEAGGLLHQHVAAKSGRRSGARPRAR